MSVAEQQPRKQLSRPHVLAITSGKGGVGKSSIAVNLGLSLVKTGARVCILDADTGLANVNILLGLQPEWRLEHVLFGARTIEEVLLEGPLGLKVIPGATGISECVTLHPRQQLRLTRELGRIEHDFDYLLLDTAAGIGDTTLDFVSAAHQTLLVITPEPTSLTDAFSLVKLMSRRRRGMVYQVVVNMCASANEARQIFHRFSAAVEKYIGLRVRLLGFIQRDESLRSAVTLQSPVALFPDNDPSSRSFLRLAEALQSSLAEVGEPPSFAGYWQQQFRRGGRLESPPAGPAAVVGARDEVVVEQLATEADSGEGLLERELAAWEQQWRRLVEEEKMPGDVLAQALVVCHEVFWQRFEKPALALPALVSRLADDPDRNFELLNSVRAALPPIADVVPEDPTPVASVSEPPASESSPLAVAAQSAPNPAPDTETSRTHCYDENHYGSQQHLTELLQRQGARGKTVLELIQALS